jgi:hypothetical protein
MNCFKNCKQGLTPMTHIFETLRRTILLRCLLWILALITAITLACQLLVPSVGIIGITLISNDQELSVSSFKLPSVAILSHELQTIRYFSTSQPTLKLFSASTDASFVFDEGKIPLVLSSKPNQTLPLTTSADSKLTTNAYVKGVLFDEKLFRPLYVFQYGGGLMVTTLQDNRTVLVHDYSQDINDVLRLMSTSKARIDSLLQRYPSDSFTYGYISEPSQGRSSLNVFSGERIRSIQISHRFGFAQKFRFHSVKSEVIYFDYRTLCVWDYENGTRTEIMTFEADRFPIAYDMTRDFKYMYGICNSTLEKWDLSLAPPRVISSKTLNDVFGFRYRIGIVN